MKLTSKNKKRIILAITGSIAAYKMLTVMRELRKAGHEVRVMLTRQGEYFVTATTCEALSGQPVIRESSGEMAHIHLTRWADCFCIAPATAHTLAKCALGLAADLVSESYLAATCPIWFAPAMNPTMWHHPSTQHNIQILRANGHQIISPVEGKQACGDRGIGNLAAPETIFQALTQSQDSSLTNKHFVITAGATREHFDPVRFISSPSSGRMGFALAEAAKRRGAKVTLITGPTAYPPSQHTIQVTSANAMYDAVMAHLPCDVFIGAAAVADYAPEHLAPHKIKKTSQPHTVKLLPTQDIIQAVSLSQPRPFCIGFAAETENILTHANNKRQLKKLDLIVANDVSQSDIGFSQPDNAVTLISAEHTVTVGKAPKPLIAEKILDEAERLMAETVPA